MDYIIDLDQNGVLVHNTLLLFPLHSRVLIQRQVAKGIAVLIATAFDVG